VCEVEDGVVAPERRRVKGERPAMTILGPPRAGTGELRAVYGKELTMLACSVYAL